jgi:hypothetical protein
MYQDNRNEFGCPLLNQRGAEGVRDFHAIIAQLSPPQRAAFELERDMRRRELERLRAAAAQEEAALARRLLALGRLRARVAESDVPRRIASRLPRPNAQQLRHRGAQATNSICATLFRALARMRSAR